MTRSANRVFKTVQPCLVYFAMSTCGSRRTVPLFGRTNALVATIDVSAAERLVQSSALTHRWAKSNTLISACGSPERLNVRSAVR